MQSLLGDAESSSCARLHPGDGDTDNTNGNPSRHPDDHIGVLVLGLTAARWDAATTTLGGRPLFCQLWWPEVRLVVTVAAVAEAIGDAEMEALLQRNHEPPG
jgi:hypothetical protein